ncbi:MAG: DNA pilot protein [Microviridae sp.]|nr:MAG: DNA pilot protein [Microviridae sp.]
MPDASILPFAGDLINANKELISSGVNIMTQSIMNKAQKRWAEKMYERQRNDALADWNRENEYNSPSGQMARLKAAGLNPNLVYGHGATATGGDIRNSSPGDYNPKTSEVHTSQSMFNYMDLKMKEAQIDNLRTINTVNVEEAALKAAQRNNVEAETRRRSFDYELESETRPYSVEARRSSVAKMEAETKTMLDRNEREIALNSSNLKEAAERILTARLQRAKTAEEIKHIKAQIANIKVDTALKAYEEKLNKEGMTKGDKIYWRKLNELIRSGKIQETVKKIATKIASPIGGYGKLKIDSTLRR